MNENYIKRADYYMGRLMDEPEPPTPEDEVERAPNVVSQWSVINNPEEQNGN